MKIQYRSSELIIFESSLFRTTSSLLIGEDYILLVDPNWLPIELEFIEETIHSIGKEKEKYLLFTHSDYDHIIGYGKFKEYKTIASENFVKSLSKEAVLKDIVKFDDEYYVKRAYKIEYPQIDIVVSGDDEKLRIGSDEYCFFQAKGHNSDGLLTINKTKRILIAGDYLSNIEFPYIYDSIKRYLETLSKFEEILTKENIDLLIPGHGDFAVDKDEMKIRINESRKYIEELERSIKKKSTFNKKELFDKYDFPIIMNQFHQNNLKLVTAELEDNSM